MWEPPTLGLSFFIYVLKNTINLPQNLVSILYLSTMQKICFGMQLHTIVTEGAGLLGQGSSGQMFVVHVIVDCFPFTNVNVKLLVDSITDGCLIENWLLCINKKKIKMLVQ